MSYVVAGRWEWWMWFICSRIVSIMWNMSKLLPGAVRNFKLYFLRGINWSSSSQQSHEVFEQSDSKLFTTSTVNCKLDESSTKLMKLLFQLDLVRGCQPRTYFKRPQRKFNYFAQVESGSYFGANIVLAWTTLVVNLAKHVGKLLCCIERCQDANIKHE